MSRLQASDCLRVNAHTNAFREPQQILPMLAWDRTVSARGMRLTPATNCRAVELKLLRDVGSAAQPFDDRVGWLAGVNEVCRHFDFAQLLRLAHQPTYLNALPLANA
jgi:hypothetical protein